MFYSHEILTSRQYGVATIWLIATVGPKSGTRKVTRKAIQEVNVRKACEKIIAPGAPMALRLQSSLLYGVSRVYSQQCTYVLSDAEKVQSDMKMFYQMIANNETDPQAGKAKRTQNIIEDDPGFIPNNNIPKFDFDTEGNIVFVSSQNSSKKSSQFSLANSGDSSSGRGNSIIGINLSQSDRGSYQFPSPFGPPFSAQKTLQVMNPFEEPEDLAPIGGFDLEIDADGNLIGVVEQELELPPLPRPVSQFQRDPTEQVEPMAQEGGQVLQLAEGEGDIIMMDEDALPEAEAFPIRQRPKKRPSQEAVSDQATAAARRGRPRKATGFLDETTELSRRVIKSWQEQYIAVNEKTRKARHPVGIVQARRNAHDLTYGFGISNVGQITGIPGIMHPLADLFAGDGLRDRLLGTQADEEVPIAAGGRRRRSASAAFEGEEEEEGRNVRQRLEETPGQGRSVGGIVDEMEGIFGDETVPEIGMDAEPPMDDHLSSSIMPWNRTPSVAPPSSTRGHQHRVGSQQLTASPRRSIIQPIEPFSDAAVAEMGSEIFQPLQSLDSSFENFGPAAAVDTQQAADSQWMRSALDTASEEFLGYAKEQAKEMGEVKADDKKKNRRWVKFEALADPAKHTKIVAAQAFYHVLTLATKNAVSVEQDGPTYQPFGKIRIGVDTMEESKTGEDQEL